MSDFGAEIARIGKLSDGSAAAKACLHTKLSWAVSYMYMPYAMTSASQQVQLIDSFLSYGYGWASLGDRSETYTQAQAAPYGCDFPILREVNGNGTVDNFVGYGWMSWMG